MKEPSTAYLFLHTHWDREWYLPFEVYRARLVSVVRSVVEGLKTGELPNFLLDGQASVLEDVMEIDPSLYSSIQDLMEQKVLTAGPWYVLADQMLVGGESLIRNLQQGLETTSMYGNPAMIGYCPDTFGHTADLPRILKGFNIDSAYVWRGVPKMDAGPAFLWRSNDGSEVIAFHLSRGYYDANFHNATESTDLIAHLNKWMPPNELHFCKALNAGLIPVGADHLAPPKDMDRLLKKLASATSGKKSNNGGAMVPKVVPIALSEFSQKLHQSAAVGSLPLVAGELRDNSAALTFERAYLLQGVLSSRLYLKRENRIAEHRLLSIAEPMHSILYLEKISDYPLMELKHAWKLLMKNHPHDSICGCSIDSVHREMQSRTIKFHELLNALDAESARAIASESGRSALLTAARPFPLVDPTFSPSKLSIFSTSGESLLSPVPFSWTSEENSYSQPFIDDVEGADVQIISSKNSVEIFSGPGGEPVVKTVVVHNGWLWTGKLPAFGGKTVNWGVAAPSKTPKKLSKKVESIKHSSEWVSCEKSRISNEFLSVEIENDGTLVVTSTDNKQRHKIHRLKHFFRNVADCGDSYNFDPIPDDKPFLSKFLSVRANLLGPLVGSLIVEYEIKIPVQAEEKVKSTSTDGFPDGPSIFGRSSKIFTHKIRTEISLRRGVPLIYFDTDWENKSVDHRLEVVFDTELDIETSFAENHFSVVTRRRPHLKTSLPVAKGTEAPLDRLACQRFFVANDQAFFNLGLPEYGLDDSFACMTILRAFSHLSRSRLQTRGGGAGPCVPTPEGNCLGPNSVRYGWAPLHSAKSSDKERLPAAQLIQTYRLAELFEGRFSAVLTDSALAKNVSTHMIIENPAVRLMSAYIFDHSLYLRLLNVTDVEQDTQINLRVPASAAYLCKLNQETIKPLPIERIEHTPLSRISLLPGKNELLTVRLDLD